MSNRASTREERRKREAKVRAVLQRSFRDEAPPDVDNGVLNVYQHSHFQRWMYCLARHDNKIIGVVTPNNVRVRKDTVYKDLFIQMAEQKGKRLVEIDSYPFDFDTTDFGWAIPNRASPFEPSASPPTEEGRSIPLHSPVDNWTSETHRAHIIQHMYEEPVLRNLRSRYSNQIQTASGITLEEAVDPSFIDPEAMPF